MRLGPLVRIAERATRRVSGGRWGVLDLAGLPSVELTVIGRKSGLPRTVSLLYVPDGAGEDTFLLIGSNWGLPQHPAWSANLLHTTTAELNSDGERFAVKVRHLADVEREQAWRRAVAFWPGYLMEQRLAQPRQFRLFELRRS